MQPKEWTKIVHNPQLDVELLHAYYVQHAYPRHSHDYYVISLIARGRQSFTTGRKTSHTAGRTNFDQSGSRSYRGSGRHARI